VVLSADRGRRGRPPVGQLRRPYGTGDGEPDGHPTLLPVAAAGRARSSAAEPRRPRGRYRGIRGRFAGVLPAAAGRCRPSAQRLGSTDCRPAGRGQCPVQHRVGHAPVSRDDPTTAPISSCDENLSIGEK